MESGYENGRFVILWICAIFRTEVFLKFVWFSAKYSENLSKEILMDNLNSKLLKKKGGV